MRCSIPWTLAMTLLLVLAALSGCPKDDDSGEQSITEAEARTPAPPGETDTLLLAHAYFLTEPDATTGKAKPVPGPAKLTMVRGDGDRWVSSILEDPESNVFHKALVVDLDGQGPAILTIGANAARLKSWRMVDGTWTATTHWAPTFGGQQERLRDMEIGDVTGDGRDDVVIATHDLGVVAVLELPADSAVAGGASWTVTELDRTEDRTFVHEVETGDVDGDGTVEIFVTPSAPNVLDGTPQPGRITGYRLRDGKPEEFQVAEFFGAHVKEILVADLEGRGRPDLIAAIEPERKIVDGAVATDDPLILRRYRWDGDKVQETDLATFRDAQCRFLVPGDLTGDGKLELVASTMTSGVWMLRQGDAGWTSELVAKDSAVAEFEHAAAILDLDGDGKNELYVMADDLPNKQGTLRRFTWDGSAFFGEVVVTIPTDHMTFNITGGKL